MGSTKHLVYYDEELGAANILEITDDLKQMSIQRARTSSIKGNYIYNIMYDTAIRTFVGTNGKLNRFDGKNVVVIGKINAEKFIIYANNKVSVATNKQIAQYCKKYNVSIANGRIYNNYLIGAISGNYLNFNLEGDGSNEIRGYQDGDRAGQGKVYTASVEEERQQATSDRVGGMDSSISRQGGTHKCDTSQHKGCDIYDGLTTEAKRASNTEFYSAIKLMKENSENGACVSLYSEDDYKSMSCYLFDNGLAGVAVKGKDIVSVFKHPDSEVRGFARLAIIQGIKAGGDRLDCYDIDGKLPTIYCKAGMIPICKIKFNRDFAPDNWDYDRDGEPDIVFMAHCGDEASKIENNYGNYKKYIDYENVPYIYDSTTECAYDRAIMFRDNWITDRKANAINNANSVRNLIKAFSR